MLFVSILFTVTIFLAWFVVYLRCVDSFILISPAHLTTRPGTSRGSWVPSSSPPYWRWIHPLAIFSKPQAETCQSQSTQDWLIISTKLTVIPMVVCVINLQVLPASWNHYRQHEQLLGDWCRSSSGEMKTMMKTVQLDNLTVQCVVSAINIL